MIKVLFIPDADVKDQIKDIPRKVHAKLVKDAAVIENRVDKPSRVSLRFVADADDKVYIEDVPHIARAKQKTRKRNKDDNAETPNKRPKWAEESEEIRRLRSRLARRDETIARRDATIEVLQDENRNLKAEVVMLRMKLQKRAPSSYSSYSDTDEEDYFSDDEQRRISKPCCDWKVRPGDKLTGETGQYWVDSKFFQADYSTIWIVRNTENQQFVMKNVTFSLQRSVAMKEIDILRHIHTKLSKEENYVIQLKDTCTVKVGGCEHILLVLEELKGPDLLRLTQKYKGGLPLAHALRLLRDILLGLRNIHDCGVIHTDIKLENIVLCSDRDHGDRRIDKNRPKGDAPGDGPMLKIIDFGTAWKEGDHLQRKVQSRTYRAPEVIVGLPYNQSIDIWSVGCVFYELLTGNVLFNVDIAGDLVDARHLREMELVLGPPPDMFKMQRSFYDGGGNLVGLARSPGTEARFRLEQIQLNPEQEELVDQFLRFILEWDPDLRPSAADCLQHNIFRDHL